MKNFKKNDKVKWKWGNGTAEGKIIEVFHEDVTKNIKGSEITRNASKDEPAYLIKQDDGDEVLKSYSEISAK